MRGPLASRMLRAATRVDRVGFVFFSIFPLRPSLSVCFPRTCRFLFFFLTTLVVVDDDDNDDADLYLGGGHEEIDGDDESRAEFLCPFCADDYDVVGLCCHIDEEHPVEAKNGVPISFFSLIFGYNSLLKFIFYLISE
jgi:hypothetical protein